MRLFVSSTLIYFCIFLLSYTSVMAQVTCECVECPPNYIACCHYESGRCRGKCLPIIQRNQWRPPSSLEATANFFVELLEINYGNFDMVKDREKFLPIIEALLKNNGNDAVNLSFENQKIEVVIPEIKQAKYLFLLQAYKILNSLPKTPKFPACNSVSRLEKYRQELKKFNKDIERIKRTDLDTYESLKEEYSKGLKQYKLAVKQNACRR